MKIKFLTLVFIFFGFSVGYINAWCMEPSASFISTPTKPNVPFCINTFNNTHTCSDWEINEYYDDIEDYNEEVEEFVSELNDYVDEAVEYAQCRMNELE
ncbi:hypothetical protein N8128_06800 [Paracoccaceae bacterium]|nr:hypothetical protein [Paracoccaceae bacterium]